MYPKDPLAQLETSKSGIKDSFIKKFIKKHKENGDIKFVPVYFNSTTKTVINSKYDLDKSFQEILYRINNWINKGSGCVTESIDAEYVNITIYSPLSASSFIKLPVKLRNSVKGLITIKNNDNKCFLWCKNNKSR